ncbi:hypothetical protein CXF83_14550 [Shewanella sp. Choline-02u-19]|uniref:hypothetical protein n=1 Tax=unclassified Shewanella TaxID=196818 RepID=UPI000C34844F|nr:MULTISPECIES: hypothetical protein [unclassified Shewanella]PKG72580.1 hypothetical protein CXF86_21840 [Shewanella sp. GutCb]PKH57043.1 hypothetical protein CXF84_11260 [Shewanella sp. Bg11-22]PKI27840.1 hypothetical protein CXF83_14550 [Shewanella sp. Choline-02u-19]
MFTYAHEGEHFYTQAIVIDSITEILLMESIEGHFYKELLSSGIDLLLLESHIIDFIMWQFIEHNETVIGINVSNSIAEFIYFYY